MLDIMTRASHCNPPYEELPRSRMDPRPRLDMTNKEDIGLGLWVPNKSFVYSHHSISVKGYFYKMVEKVIARLV